MRIIQKRGLSGIIPPEHSETFKHSPLLITTTFVDADGASGLVAREQRLSRLRCHGCHFNMHYTRRAGGMVRGVNAGAPVYRLHRRDVLG